jgi:hypothetical protein
MIKNFFYKDLNVDMWFYCLAAIAILQGFDIGTSYFAFNNGLGYEGNPNVAGILHSPILVFFIKVLPVVGMSLILYMNMDHIRNSVISRWAYMICLCAAIVICISPVVSNTYGIMTGQNIFPEYLLPPNLF